VEHPPASQDARDPGPGATLVVTDGGLAGLVACLLLDAPEDAVAWIPPLGAELLDVPGAPVVEACRSAVERHADVLGLGDVILSRDLAPDAPAWMMLQRACEIGADRGCANVDWPLFAGDDLGRMADGAECARLVSRLNMLPSVPGAAAPREPVEVAVPLADLSAAKLADLALDLDVPFELLWWRSAPDQSLASVVDARLAWDGLLRDIAAQRGIIWNPGALDPATPA